VQHSTVVIIIPPTLCRASTGQLFSEAAKDDDEAKAAMFSFFLKNAIHH
jgi:hypothetical protein